MFGHRPRFSPIWLRQPQAAARREASATPHSIKLRSGFTLVEMLVAVGLTVLMMTMVVTVFGLVMDSIRDSRGGVEVNDRLRAAKNRLQLDLAGLTVTVAPPRNPVLDEGYLEYIEGPIGPVIAAGDLARTDQTDASGNLLPDSTVGDTDDILMFTTRSNGEPFVGRMPTFNGTIIIPQTVQSQVAEVCWFVRGTTLYRRTLLVYQPPAGVRTPTLSESIGKTPHFYTCNDLSVRLAGTPSFSGASPDFSLVNFAFNTLGDLTKRENRYAHQIFAWPHDARFWSQMGLPTLEECAGGMFDYADMAAANFVDSSVDNNKLFYPNKSDGTPLSQIDSVSPYFSPRISLTISDPAKLPFDAWRRPHPYAEQDPATGQVRTQGTRVGEDVILTDVLSFDIKVWDPGAPIVEKSDGTVVMPSDPPLDGGGSFQPPAIVQALTDVANASARLVGFGAYVDLNYLCRMGPSGGGSDPGVPLYDFATYSATLTPTPPSVPQPQFHHAGDLRSGLWGTYPSDLSGLTTVDLITKRDDGTLGALLRASVYDTYSTHYETDGINQTAVPWNASPQTNADTGTDGLNSNSNGAIDESSAWPDVTSGEKETAPPYPHPLRGIQIKIRVFEPSTRQIREVTLEHEFVSQ